MSGSKQIVQTLQWCPEAWDVVTLEIEGKVEGRMVSGKVVKCYTCKPERCGGKGFCWVNHQIYTALSV